MKKSGSARYMAIFCFLLLLFLSPMFLAETSEKAIQTFEEEEVPEVERHSDNNSSGGGFEETPYAETVALLSGDPLSKALNYLKSVQGIDGRISDFATSCWAVMAIAAAGENPHNWKKPGGKSIVDYLIEYRHLVNLNVPTDVARFILAMTAAREDPRNVSGTNYVEILKGFFNNNQIGSPSQLNDDFWGVMALVSAGEAANSTIIQGSVNFIKTHQNADGGWSWAVGVSSDVDDTSAAVMALISAGEDNSTSTIAKALQYLKSQQQPNGGFSSWGTVNSASDSWAIGAICSVGQNPADWRVNNISVVDHLLSLQNADGSFNWTATTPANKALMTSYAIVALSFRQYPTNGLPIYVRIEGKQATIWRRKVFVAASIIVDDAGQLHYLPKPTVLGALDKAAEIGGFTYKVRQTGFGLYVYSIAGEEAAGLSGWMYRVDYYMPYVGMADFEWGVTSPPNPPHKELLIYYGTWTAMPLKIWVDKTEVHVGENITVRVTYYNDTSGCWQPLEGATVHFLNRRYTTNATGFVTIKVRYDPPVWAEKAGYIRSDVIEVRILANPVGGSVGSNTASGQQNTENNADTPFSSEPRGHIWLGFHLFEIVC
ncbi:MAG: prenyltransferase/squalene oxidase repeat-containing protein [Nitrososphaerota archaeon]|nr:prenyltransferase/squalene oxidase repeat-containing protein [Nitrososphaerota archaeon]